MRIEHIAIWTRDLDRLRDFYIAYFGATANELYKSSRRPFESYFLTFAADGGARLELMKLPQLLEPAGPEAVGYAHIAVAVGSRAAVDALTAKLRDAGCPILSEPRLTGDGYYESTIGDPDGNTVEITA